MKITLGKFSIEISTEQVFILAGLFFFLCVVTATIFDKLIDKL